MSLHALPPNPCLVAILLVCRSSSGPRLVFHYPPKPGEDNTRYRYLFKDDRTDTSSTSSSTESSAEEDNKDEIAEREEQQGSSPPDADEFGSASPLRATGVVRPDRKKPQWNDIFGYQSSVLARALCPAPQSLKRFEVSLGEYTFLGRPSYGNEDGSWRKKRRRSSSMSKSLGGKASVATNSSRSRPRNSALDATSGDSTGPEIDEDPQFTSSAKQQRPKRGSDDSHSASNTSVSNFTPTQQASKDPLLMFHVVYVLRTPPLEYHIRNKDMWTHVVRKFSKALKQEQERASYVEKEITLIASAVKRAKKASGDNPLLPTLYHDIISQSDLAKSIALLYNGISNSKVAHLPLTPSSSISMQIPVPRSISTLPGPLMRQMPGLWLTTSTVIPDDDDVQLSDSNLGARFTLLLLHDVKSILADISAAQSPITDPLTHYLNVTTPTKSFQQISQSSDIPLLDIQFLASHLIYWRRAQAIPPLHQRDTYIASPNANLGNIASATASFAKSFPTSPSLPKILSLLSSSPRPYSSIIPSKDHKGLYMDILARLLREGWVTQLRSFAWVRVPPFIKATVDKELDRTGVAGKGIVEGTDATIETRNGAPVSPISSTGTAIPIARSADNQTSSLICNPRFASAIPSRYLASLSTHIGQILGPDSKAGWDKCNRYFDGKHAIETIAVGEGWKRKYVGDLINSWEELGFLVKVRHW